MENPSPKTINKFALKEMAIYALHHGIEKSKQGSQSPSHYIIEGFYFGFYQTFFTLLEKCGLYYLELLIVHFKDNFRIFV